MYCRICSSTKNVRYYKKYRMSMCRDCQQYSAQKGTTAKLTKEQFEKKFWGEELEDVHWHTRKMFYQDYLASTGTFEEYEESTRSY